MDVFYVSEKFAKQRNFNARLIVLLMRYPRVRRIIICGHVNDVMKELTRRGNPPNQPVSLRTSSELSFGKNPDLTNYRHLPIIKNRCKLQNVTNVRAYSIL